MCPTSTGTCEAEVRLCMKQSSQESTNAGLLTRRLHAPPDGNPCTGECITGQVAGMIRNTPRVSKAPGSTGYVSRPEPADRTGLCHSINLVGGCTDVGTDS